MITETREIYKCEYCKKIYQKKHSCVKHEAGCRKRPDYIRPCHGCIILDKIKKTIFAGYYDDYDNECTKDVEVLFCKSKNCYIHPPSVEAKGNAIDFGDKPNIVMPKDCSDFTGSWL